jgi:hypothetical protein
MMDSTNDPKPLLATLTASLSLAPELKTRLEFDAMVKEFDTLRAEVTTRIQKQQEITNFSIALIVGFAAISRFLLDSKPGQTSLSFEPLYPTISILFSAFALMIIDHEANIAHIYRYTDTELRPRMQYLLGDMGTTVWRWNECRASWQHHSGVTNAFFYAMAWSKYAMTVLPSIAFVVAYWRVREAPVPNWERATFIASLALFLIVFLSLVYVGLQYNRMGTFVDSRGESPIPSK